MLKSQRHRSSIFHQRYGPYESSCVEYTLPTIPQCATGNIEPKDSWDDPFFIHQKVKDERVRQARSERTPMKIAR